MNNKTSRMIRIGEWLFEVKVARAIRTDAFGKPYDAAAQVGLHGTTMHIDTQLVKDGRCFSREDYQAFYEFASLMGIEQVEYDRYIGGKRITRQVSINQDEVNSPLVLKNTG